jgi:Domain of unknown function (DUF4260)
MKKLIAAEEFAQMVLCLYLLFQLPDHVSVLALIPLFFIPDLFAIGFLVSNATGAFLYNFSHHKLVAIALAAIGYFLPSSFLLQAGIIFYAHSAFDRTLGYGLKYLGNHSKTHLGFIGKEKHLNPPDLI